MKKKIVGLLICIAVCYSVKGQAQDYAVTVSLDTVRGDFSFLTNPYRGQVLQIKDGKEKKTYLAHKISLVKRNGDLFHVAKIEGLYQFVKFVHGGFMSLYNYTPLEGENVQLFQSSILIMKDGRQLPVPNLSFKKSMSAFLDDCKSVKNKIANGEYRKKNLTAIIDEYNTCLPTSIVKNYNKKAPIDSEPSKIKSLIDQVRSHDQLSSNTELLEMLNDVKKRLDSDEEIPGYLSKLLSAELSGSEDLLKLLNAALTK